MASKARRIGMALLSVLLAAALFIGLFPQGLKASAQEQAETAEQQTLDIAVLSDIHVLPSELIKNTDDYTDALNSDRKIFTESQGILDRMLAEVVEQAPDVLMISGDLTKDGELESHKYVAEQLAELKEQLPDIKIYVTNGNHDVNNNLAYNYNTEDGVKVPATRTTPELFLETYADTVYNEANGIVAQFKPSTYTEDVNGDKAGMLSYVAEPAEGYTIIVVDSGRYSADNTDEGTAEHQTSGQISAELQAWVVEQAQAAVAKGNTVIGMMHHGLIEHFDMEEEFLGEYLVNDYQAVSAAFADAGIHYVFTGHMHANDIATMTTEAGNELYDIETGSAVTYPCPMRFVTFTSETVGEERSVEAAIDTVTNLDNITYLTADKTEATIDDLTAYAKQPQFGLSEGVITNLGTGLVDGLLDSVQTTGVGPAIESLIGSLLGMDVDLDTAIDLIAALIDGKPEDPEVAADTTAWKDSNGNIFVNMAGGVTISVQGLKESLNFLISELDRLIKEERETVDSVIEQAIRDILAIVVYEGADGEEDVTLLQLVNDVYQSHLSGDDNGNRPAYIDTVMAGLNDGTMLPTLLGDIIDKLWDAIVDLSGEISLKEFTGIGLIELVKDGDTITAYDPQPLEDRTAPLIVINEDGTSGVLNLLFAFVLGQKVDKTDTYWEIREDATVKDLLGNSLLGLVLDVPEMLNELLLGTPATDTEPATEGLLSAETQQTITDLLGGIIDSMSKDTNYPYDGDTLIKVSYSLAQGGDTSDQEALIEQLQGAVDGLEDAVAGLESDLGWAEGSLQSQIDSLSAALGKAQDQLEALDETYATGEEVAEQVEALRAQLTEAIAAAQTAVQAKVDAVQAELDKAVTDLQASIDKAASDLQASVDGSLSGLSADLDAVEEAYAAADALLRSDLTELADAGDSLRDSLSALEGSYAEADEAIWAAVEQLQSSVGSLETETDELAAGLHTVTIVAWVLVAVVAVAIVGGGIGFFLLRRR